MDMTERREAMSLLEEVRQSRSLPTPTEARDIRQRAGVSQERLAAELGVHRMTVARWEAGETAPRGVQRARYAELLRAIEAMATA